MAPTLRDVYGVASHYGFDASTVYYSARDRDKLNLVREIDSDAHIQPTIITPELFGAENMHMPGHYVSPRTAYNKAALNDLARYVRQKRCSAIDTPTSDIRLPLVELADSLRTGFCTHPSGPRRVDAANDLYGAVGLLEQFSRTSGQPVTLKVDDIAAARAVVSARRSGLGCPVPTLERMMGVHFVAPQVV